MTFLAKSRILAAFGLALAAMPAFAQSHTDTPLLVVRFNQDRVYYQQALYNAVAKAIEAKPGVFFNIVAVVPQTNNEKTNEHYQKDTANRAGVLVGDMVKMGVPQNRLKVSYHKSPAPSPEVHVFVE